jgi:hypothetical protein
LNFLLNIDGVMLKSRTAITGTSLGAQGVERAPGDFAAV